MPRLRPRASRVLRAAGRAPQPVLGLVRRRNQPIVVRTLRSTVAAVLAFVVAVWLSGNPRPLLAPLTALLVVQVTLYQTLTIGIRRVCSVVLGVLIAVGFAEFVSLSWWTLGVLILSALVLGHLLKVAPFVEEVAISGMLVLGVNTLHGQHSTAWGRIGETLIGAGVGMLFNLVLAPPMFVQPAGEAIEDLGRRLSALLLRIGDDLRGGASHQQALSWLDEARTLDNDIVRVDAALTQAEESLRLNPRAARHELHAGLILRSGLDTLEHVTVTLRSVCRGLAELPTEAGPRYEQVYPEEVGTALDDLFRALATGVSAFGSMVTAEITATAQHAEETLTDALRRAREDRRRIGQLLRSETEIEPDTWELHGSLLAGLDRIIRELDVEKRAQPRSQARPPRTARAAKAVLRGVRHTYPGAARRALEAGTGRGRAARQTQPTRDRQDRPGRGWGQEAQVWEAEAVGHAERAGDRGGGGGTGRNSEPDDGDVPPESQRP